MMALDWVNCVRFFGDMHAHRICVRVSVRNVQDVMELLLTAVLCESVYTPYTSVIFVLYSYDMYEVRSRLCTSIYTPMIIISTSRITQVQLGC